MKGFVGYCEKNRKLSHRELRNAGQTKFVSVCRVSDHRVTLATEMSGFDVSLCLHHRSDAFERTVLRA